MSTVTTPAPAVITTLQGIEEFADQTGQDFFDLLLDRLETLERSTVTDLFETAQRLNVPASLLLEIFDERTSSMPKPTGVGGSLRRIRTAAGLSVTELAHEVGTSPRYLARVEADLVWCSRLFAGRVAQVAAAHLGGAA